MPEAALPHNKGMRLFMRHLVLGLVGVIVAVAGATVRPAPAAASNGHGRKVDDRLARAVDTSSPNDAVRVVIVGTEKKGPGSGHHYGQVRHELPLLGGVSETIKAKDLDKLASDPGVSFVAADAPITPTGTGSVNYSNLVTTYPGTDKAPKVWDVGYNGAGVGIAVIDSGAVAVADFGTRLVQVQLPWMIAPTPDVNGHGTMVAGIAAGQSTDGKFIGLAPGATVYALNVDRPEGTHSSDVIDALQWVYDHAHEYNIRVVNLSLSETVPGSYTQSTLDLAVERVWAAGIAVVAAGGNLGSAAGSTDYAPANDPLALTVGAADATGKVLYPASFSSVGTTADGFAKPDLLAPGRLVAAPLPATTTLGLQAPPANRVAPGYATISGTSFAAPQVAGAAALLFQQHPEWSPDMVKGALVKNTHAVSSTTLGALDLGFAPKYTGSPPLANQGVPALVCAPGATCLTGSTIASNWDSSSWNSASWSSSSWSSSSWNSSSWNSSSWNSSSWNSSSWNSYSWN